MDLDHGPNSEKKLPPGSGPIRPTGSDFSPGGYCFRPFSTPPCPTIGSNKTLPFRFLSAFSRDLPMGVRVSGKTRVVDVGRARSTWQWRRS